MIQDNNNYMGSIEYNVNECDDGTHRGDRRCGRATRNLGGIYAVWFFRLLFSLEFALFIMIGRNGGYADNRRYGGTGYRESIIAYFCDVICGLVIAQVYIIYDVKD